MSKNDTELNPLLNTLNVLFCVHMNYKPCSQLRIIEKNTNMKNSVKEYTTRRHNLYPPANYQKKKKNKNRTILYSPIFLVESRGADKIFCMNRYTDAVLLTHNNFFYQFFFYYKSHSLKLSQYHFLETH